MKKSVDNEKIVWYIINCHPEKWVIKKRFSSLKTEQNVNLSSRIKTYKIDIFDRYLFFLRV